MMARNFQPGQMVIAKHTLNAAVLQPLLPTVEKGARLIVIRENPKGILQVCRRHGSETFGVWEFDVEPDPCGA